MNDHQSKRIGPEQSDDTTDHIYEMFELLEEAISTRDSEGSSVTDIHIDDKNPISHQTEEEKIWSNPAEGIYYPNSNLHEQQYYMQYMHLSSVLERGLTGIHSELCQLSRSVFQLVYGMKECADTMGFYTTKMLAFQKQMLHVTSRTNSSLQTGVHLLQDLKAKLGPSPKDLSRANSRDENPGWFNESRAKRHYRDVESRSPVDSSSRYSKRDKKK